MLTKYKKYEVVPWPFSTCDLYSEGNFFYFMIAVFLKIRLYSQDDLIRGEGGGDFRTF